MKGTRLLMVLLLSLTFIPSGFATQSDEAVEVVSSELKIKNHRLEGTVDLCNQKSEALDITIQAKNAETNHLYRRNIRLNKSACETFDLNFSGDFSEMANTGDHIEFWVKRAIGKQTQNSFRVKNKYIGLIEKDSNSKEDSLCHDIESGDGIYPNFCPQHFINHESTGLRIKLLKQDGERMELLVHHVRWGGTKKILLRKGKDFTVVTSYPRYHRVTLSYLENGIFKLSSK